MKLLAVDGNNQLNRAWYAYPKLTSGSGFPTGAITGFVEFLHSETEKFGAKRIVTAFDHSAPTTKHELYPEYKATRTRDPEKRDMFRQMAPLKELLRAAGLPTYCKRGMEADEVVATKVRQWLDLDEDNTALIMSSDKDYLSMVDDRVKVLVFIPQRKVMDEQAVAEKFGIPPSKMIEYLMLLGDKIDNIPGVYKCGHVTAAKLLNEYGKIKNIDVNKLTPALRKNFVEAKKHFKVTRKLVTLNLELPVSEKFAGRYDEYLVKQLCAELNLKKTYNKLNDLADMLGLKRK